MEFLVESFTNLDYPSIAIAILSALIIFISGERWVEKQRTRKTHSMLLNDKVLKPWINQLDSHYCKIGVQDFPENIREGEPYKEKYKKLVSTNLEELEYFNYVESHLKSKYPEVLQDWRHLKETSENYNNTLVLVLNDMYTAIAEMTRLPTRFVYGNIEGKTINEYIVPWFVAITFYRWIAQEIRGKPVSKLIFQLCGDTNRYEWMAFDYSGVPNKTAVVVKSKEIGEKTVQNMYRTLKQDYLERITHSVKLEDEIIKGKRDFKAKVKETLIDPIDNGKIIMGKCNLCK